MSVVALGSRFGIRVRDEYDYAHIEEELRGALDDSGFEPVARVERSKLGTALHLLWFGPDQRPPTETVTALTSGLETRFGHGLFRLLWDRGVFAATLAEVEIEARLAERR